MLALSQSSSSSPWNHHYHHHNCRHRRLMPLCHHRRRHPCPSTIIFFIAIVLQLSMIAAASPPSKGYHTTKFQWSQSVDPMTGIASSLETSSSSSSSFITHDDDDDDDDDDEDGGGVTLSMFRTGTFGKQRRQRLDSSSVVKDVFEHYPDFISRWGVTFGLYSTKRRQQKPQNNGKRRNNHDDDKDCVIDLYNPLLRASFLTFGSARHHRRCWRGHAQQRTTSVTEFPIVGGLLLHHQHHQNDERTTPSKDRRGQSLGSLRFEMVQNVVREKSPASFSSSSSNDGNNHQRQATTTTTTTTELKTEIVGYRPSLIGNGLPANPIQMGLYRYTQRLAHAYVMSRYHRYVLEEIERKRLED